VRRPRTARILLAVGGVLVLLLIVIVVVGEVVVRPAVEDEIARGLAREFMLDDEPDVEVEGFPFVLRAVQEHLDGIDISVAGQVFEGMRVEDVGLHIDDVRFDTSELLDGSGTVLISGGDGRAVVSDHDLTAYLVSTNLPVRVEFERGTVRVSGAVAVSGITADASVSGELVLDGAVLRFTPTAVDAGSIGGGVDVAEVESALRRHFTFTAPVPQLAGVQLTDVEIGDGTATIGAVFGSLAVAY
jgi:hypothetical protein